jgi:hypothetical protein
MVQELRDPNFKLPPGCDPSWKKADMRMMRDAAETTLAERKYAA